MENDRSHASEEQQAQDKVEPARVSTSQDLIDAHNERRQSTLGQQTEPNLERLNPPKPAAPDDAQAAEAQAVQDAPQAPAPSTERTDEQGGGSQNS